MKPVSKAVAAALLLAAGTSGIVSAQSYPAKTVRVIIAYPAGGGVDFVARLLSQRLSESWGQQVVVDSRPGGGGNIGTQIASRAPADGYNLLLSPLGPLVINPSLFSKLPFDPARDFDPVTSLISALNLLVVHPSLPVKSVKELVALAKARPGQLKFASSSHGNTDHLAGELFKSLAGVDMVHVPYKGGAPATLDLVAGQVEVFFGPVQNVISNVQAGRLRMLAAATAKRWPTMPDLPTIAEAGVPGFAVENWYGMLVPARTPKEIIATLNTELLRVLALPDVRERLASNGMIPFPSTPEQFAAYIKAETAKWAKVVKDSGARVD
jgi:tripartite-type tricarboxylate transporter receptor subunit TctC